MCIRDRSHPEGSSLLVSDSDGTIEGSFFVPGQRFRTGTREMHLLDVTAFNRDNARSVAVATFVSAGLLDTNEQDIKTTRKITIKQERIVEQPPRRQQSDDGGGRGPQFTFGHGADQVRSYSGVRYTKEGGKWVKERANERGGGKFSGNTIGEAYRNNTRDTVRTARVASASFLRSDKQLKTNIKLVNVIEGIKLYQFSYLWDTATTYVGVMAQDLLGTKYEEAVSMNRGYYMVDYSMLPVDMERII